MNILQRVGGHGDQVGKLACLDAAYVLGPSNQISGVAGCSANCLGWSHAELHHVEKLFAIVAMRINTGIGAKCHLDSGLDGSLKALSLQSPYHFFFVNIFLRQTELLRLTQNVIVVIDIHHQIGAAFFGQADPFIVNQAGVLNGINARQDRVLDALRAMSMSGDLTARHVGFIGCGFEFFGRVLRRAGGITLRKYAATGDDLDYIHAVFDLGADQVANLVDAIGDGKVSFFGKHAHPCLG